MKKILLFTRSDYDSLKWYLQAEWIMSEMKAAGAILCHKNYLQDSQIRYKTIGKPDPENYITINIIPLPDTDLIKCSLEIVKYIEENSIFTTFFENHNKNIDHLLRLTLGKKDLH